MSSIYLFKLLFLSTLIIVPGATRPFDNELSSPDDIISQIVFERRLDNTNRHKCCVENNVESKKKTILNMMINKLIKPQSSLRLSKTLLQRNKYQQYKPTAEDYFSNYNEGSLHGTFHKKDPTTVKVHKKQKLFLPFAIVKIIAKGLATGVGKKVIVGIASVGKKVIGGIKHWGIKFGHGAKKVGKKVGEKAKKGGKKIEQGNKKGNKKDKKKDKKRSDELSSEKEMNIGSDNEKNPEEEPEESEEGPSCGNENSESFDEECDAETKSNENDNSHLNRDKKYL